MSQQQIQFEHLPNLHPIPLTLFANGAVLLGTGLLSLAIPRTQAAQIGILGAVAVTAFIFGYLVGTDRI